MTVYYGWRDAGGTAHVHVSEGREHLPLDPCLDVWSHSPAGLEWGYCGSGPAQLALAMLTDATGDVAIAVELHQLWKRQYVGRLPRDDGWAISREAVLEWCTEVLAQMLAELVAERSYRGEVPHE
jgi:hypothetical protein